MSSTSAFTSGKPPASPLGVRVLALAVLQGAMEAIILLMVCGSPWLYGAVHPGFELLLYFGVSLVLALWGLRMLLEGHFVWKKCPVALCLAGLLLIGVWQTVPLSKPVLAIVSPGTSQLYGQLLPGRLELLSQDEEVPFSAKTAGATISLCPAATRTELVRLLAVFLVFAAVRNNLAGEAPLRRLSLAAAINGAALSLFALVQFSSSPPNVLYWSYPSLGRVFGPFICRNHFPFYVNLCIGLGVGLLLSRAARPRNKGGQTAQGSPASLRIPGDERFEARWPAPSFRLLRDPLYVWVCGTLTLMVGAVTFSLSRGGFLALAGGAAVCLILIRAQSTRFQRGGTVLIIAALAVMLASWFGFGLIRDRLETLSKAEAVESRLPMWAQIAPLVKDFPVWGTGLGTFRYTQRLTEGSAEDGGSVAEHAHNDYLEVLIEAGVPGLALSLLAIGLVFRLGYGVLRRAQGRVRGLALGALFAFTTLVIHSFGDFGIHIPAITLLATVLSAHLCGLSGVAGERTGGTAAADPGGGGAAEYRLRLGGLAPLLGAGTAVALGLVLCSAGWRAHRADRLWAAADRLDRKMGPDGRGEQAACLEQAARMAPGDADVQAELGRVRLQLLEEETRRLKRRSTLAAVAQTAAGAARFAAPLSAACSLAAAREIQHIRGEEGQLEQKYLFPALRNCLKARDNCPLLYEPHLVLAQYAARLHLADEPSAYLDRVKLLAASDSDVWYVCGAEDFREKEFQRAWESWRRCLELSDRYLPQILEASARTLGPEEMAESVLPGRPGTLLAAALRLYPEAGAGEQRRPFLERALRLLQKKAAPLKPEDLHVKAQAHKYLGQWDEAAAAYQELLTGQSGQAGWRFELAQVLYEQGKLEDARRALTIVLTQQPEHAQARELLALVLHELMRKR